jgi:hypothetical protein
LLIIITMTRLQLGVLVLAVAAASMVHSFQQDGGVGARRFQHRREVGQQANQRVLLLGRPRIAVSTTTALSLAQNNNKNEPGEFSRELMLREEAENPFRKVRFFLYAGLGAGAFISLLVSVTRMAAALTAGINVDLLPESSINAAVDAAGLIVLAFLWKNDLEAEQSRLQRASKGAALAKLKVRASKSLMFLDDNDAGDDDASSSSTFTTTLASLRQGRGIEKRVVIAAAGREKIASVLTEAKDLADALATNDLLVVPVLIPSIALPADLLPGPERGTDLLQPPLSECIALPVGSGWSMVVDDEVRQAIEQGIDVDKEGLCVILKKNGRVGQRTRGIFLANMVGDITRRRDAGMDVVNI